MKSTMMNQKSRMENRLHSMCDRLSPRRRLVVTVTALAAFAVIAVYMAASSFFYVEQPEIDVQHMQELKLRWAENDSINALKFKDNGLSE